MPDGLGVAQGQLVRTHPRVLVGYSGDGPVPHQHHIVAESRQVAVLSGAKALAQTHQHQQRTHAPRNPEHGEKAAQLVGCDGPEHLRKSVAKTLHNLAFYRVLARPVLVLLESIYVLDARAVPWFEQER